MAKNQNTEGAPAAALDPPPPGQTSGNSATEAERYPPPPPVASNRPLPRLGVGLPVHICDHESGKVYAAVVTHVNDDRSIVATIFRPHETVAGVGFSEAEHGLATPGRWLWPDWMTGG